MRDRRGAYRILVGRPEGKRLLGRLWRRLNECVKMNLEEVIQGGMGLMIGTGRGLL